MAASVAQLIISSPFEGSLPVFAHAPCSSTHVLPHECTLHSHPACGCIVSSALFQLAQAPGIHTSVGFIPSHRLSPPAFPPRRAPLHVLQSALISWHRASMITCPGVPCDLFSPPKCMCPCSQSAAGLRHSCRQRVTLHFRSRVFFSALVHHIPCAAFPLDLYPCGFIPQLHCVLLCLIRTLRLPFCMPFMCLSAGTAESFWNVTSLRSSVHKSSRASRMM